LRTLLGEVLGEYFCIGFDSIPRRYEVRTHLARTHPTSLTEIVSCGEEWVSRTSLKLLLTRSCSYREYAERSRPGFVLATKIENENETQEFQRSNVS
jgi:hypothetical protein